MDNKKKNNDRKKCPVCGRFASAEAVSKHDALVKGNKAMRQTLDELKAERDTLKASVSAYQTDNDELRKQAERREAEIAGLNERLKKRGEEITSLEHERSLLRGKLDVLRKRGLWARIINSDI